MWEQGKSEKNIGDIGYDFGIVLKVEEHTDGAVITLEDHRHPMAHTGISAVNENCEPDENSQKTMEAMSRSIQATYSHSVCVIIYQTLLHTTWYKDINDAAIAYEAMKQEIHELFCIWSEDVSGDEVYEWIEKFVDKYS